MCLQPASASEELREPAVWQAGDRAHWGAWHQGSTTEVPGDEISQWLEQPSVQCLRFSKETQSLAVVPVQSTCSSERRGRCAGVQMELEQDTQRGAELITVLSESCSSFGLWDITLLWVLSCC